MTERTTCGQKLKDGQIFSCVGGRTRRGDGRRSGEEMKECEPGEAEEDEERERKRRRVEEEEEDKTERSAELFLFIPVCAARSDALCLCRRAAE